MSENTIYALARTLQQSNGLKQDFNQMLSALQNTIETEYLQKIRTAAKTEKTFSVEHPPKEVTLLRALSAFTDENGREQLDRISQSLMFLHTMQHIQQNVQALSAGNLLEIRSAEGTEALPSPHSVQMAGLLLTLALLERT
ncbi:hypothetical protein [Anaerotignum sp.]